MEELEESVWSVVQQENDQGEAVQKKAQEKKLEVAEMRMLRWMCEVRKLDKIRNERIRGTTKVGEITKKVQERMLKWYGHVMRREEHCVGRRAMVMKVQGRRKRGRSKRRWLDKVKDDIKEKGMSADDVYDRATWRRICHRTSTPHKSGNKMKEGKKIKEGLCRIQILCRRHPFWSYPAGLTITDPPG